MKKFLAVILSLVCVAGLSLGCKPAEKAAAPTTDTATATETVEATAEAGDEAADAGEATEADAE
ncbi:MAG: hypothetical protein Q4G03_02530 [Planctomycetia bacterium]|nr:hypothetical protein [Planctomycetia bacterium]